MHRLALVLMLLGTSCRFDPSGAASLDSGQVVADAAVQDAGLRDAEAMVAMTDVVVGLAVSPSGRAEVFSDSACTNPAVTQVTIAALATTTTFYLRPIREGVFSLTATSNGLTPDSTNYQANACTGACTSCGAQTACCRTSCPGSDCSLDCPIGCSCNLDCQSATGTCVPRCGANAQCLIDCTSVNNCEPACALGSSCLIECDGANNCDKAACGVGAECLLICGNANNCGFDSCSGGQMTCGSGVIACGRPCP